MPTGKTKRICWAGFVGDQVVGLLEGDVKSENIPVIESDGRLIVIEEISPSKENHCKIETVTVGDGDVFIWDGNGYERRNGRFERTFFIRMKASRFERSTVPGGNNGFFFLSSRRLYHVERGKEPVRLLPKLDNIMHLSPGPDSAIILKEGKNKLGDLGKLYFPDEDEYIRIEPEVFADEDPDRIDSLHWAPCGRLVATTDKHLWAIPAEKVLSLPRFSGTTGCKRRG